MLLVGVSGFLLLISFDFIDVIVYGLTSSFFPSLLEDFGYFRTRQLLLFIQPPYLNLILVGKHALSLRLFGQVVGLVVGVQGVGGGEHRVGGAEQGVGLFDGTMAAGGEEEGGDEQEERGRAVATAGGFCGKEESVDGEQEQPGG